MRPAPCCRRAAQAAQDGAAPAIRAAHDAAARVPRPAGQLHGAPGRGALGQAAPPAAPARGSSPGGPTAGSAGACSCTVARRRAACWRSHGCHHRLGATYVVYRPVLLHLSVALWFSDHQSPAAPVCKGLWRKQ